MSNSGTASISATAPCLPVVGVRSAFFLALLVGAAVVLPTVSHLTGLSVRTLLPMHWPVLLAGLVYGWRGGAIVGLLSPVFSHLVSGMPFPPMVPIMTIELAVYGMAAGILRGHFRWHGMAAMAAALVAGRLAYIASSMILLHSSRTIGESFAALTPGLIVGIAQLLLLPPFANWWVKSSRES